MKPRKATANQNAGVDPVINQLKVRSLLYAVMAVCPDIAHTVGGASKFSANLTKAHETAVKKVFQYLKLTMDYALRYKKSDLQCLFCLQ